MNKYVAGLEKKVRVEKNVLGLKKYVARLEAIATRLDAIALRLEAIAIRFLLLLGWRPLGNCC